MTDDSFFITLGLVTLADFTLLQCYRTSVAYHTMHLIVFVHFFVVFRLTPAIRRLLRLFIRMAAPPCPSIMSSSLKFSASFVVFYMLGYLQSLQRNVDILGNWCFIEGSTHVSDTTSILCLVLFPILKMSVVSKSRLIILHKFFHPFSLDDLLYLPGGPFL